MTPENFCYWLQGAMEIFGPNELNADQVQTIKNHLNMVFVHVDAQFPASQQAALSAAHDGKTIPGKGPGAQFPGGKIPAHLDASVPDSAFPQGRPRC